MSSTPYTQDGRSNYERLLAGDWYQADSEILDKAFAAQQLAHRYNMLAHEGRSSEAQAQLVELIGQLGQHVQIRPPLRVDYGAHLSIGDRTFVNTGLVALDVAQIVIGSDCLIGPNCQLLTPTHPVEPGPRREKWESAESITIEDNVWLGGGVIICPGVTVGENSVIGAGAVVTRDVPANVVAVGNPAQVVKRLG